jgi:CheY-like chemotaxis protein
MARVLVADDDPSVLEVIRSALELASHEVEAVATESEAVLMYAGYKPDVMVLDVNMIHGGAAAILSRLDAHDEGVLCPVVVVTGDASTVTKHARIARVVQKPFSIDALCQAVSSALSLP